MDWGKLTLPQFIPGSCPSYLKHAICMLPHSDFWSDWWQWWHDGHGGRQSPAADKFSTLREEQKFIILRFNPVPKLRISWKRASAFEEGK